MKKMNFITVRLGNEDTPTVFVVDLNKICFLSFKPETKEQTAKLVLDFGASQKIFEKKEAEQLFQALENHSALNNSENTDL